MRDPIHRSYQSLDVLWRSGMTNQSQDFLLDRTTISGMVWLFSALMPLTAFVRENDDKPVRCPGESSRPGFETSMRGGKLQQNLLYCHGLLINSSVEVSSVHPTADETSLE